MSQESEILRRLEAGETLTPLDALKEVGSFRLGARIWDLRRRGHSIEKIRVTVPGGAVVAGYRMLCRTEPTTGQRLICV